MSVRSVIRLLPSQTSEKRWSRMSPHEIAIQDGDEQTSYRFDHAFDGSNTKEVFDASCKEMVETVCDGYNVTIAAYGQSGSGKTHTTIGSSEEDGIMSLSVKHLLTIINKRTTTNYMVKMSALEVYNEKIYDLFDITTKNACRLVQEKVIGAQEFNIQSFEHFTELLKRAQEQRKVAETSLNRKSSRSHAIFQIFVESLQADIEAGKQVTTSSRLLIVDLAGSENARMVSAGIQTTESKNINLSLLALSKLISQIAETPNQKIATFRESKLTRIMQPALGGNSQLLIVCCIKREDCLETNNTIQFGQKAKLIQNKVKRNEGAKDSELPKLLNQINELKRQLDEKTTKQLEDEKEKESKLEALRKIVLNSSNFVVPSSKDGKAKRRHSVAAFSSLRRDIIVPSKIDWHEECMNMLKSVKEEEEEFGMDKCFTEETNSGRSSRMSGVSTCDSSSFRPEVENSTHIDPQVHAEMVLLVDQLKKSCKVLEENAKEEQDRMKLKLEAAETKVRNLVERNETLEAEIVAVKKEASHAAEKTVQQVMDEKVLLQARMEAENKKLQKKLDFQLEKYANMKKDGLEMLQKEKKEANDAREALEASKSEVEKLKKKFNDAVPVYKSVKEKLAVETSLRQNRENELAAAHRKLEIICEEEKKLREELEQKDELLKETEEKLISMKIGRSFDVFQRDKILEGKCFYEKHARIEFMLEQATKHRDLLKKRVFQLVLEERE